MSKLDGNGRWGGKMLLTEHQEQYEQRNRTAAGKATAEELRLIRDSVLLPHLMTMVQKSLDEISRSQISMHNVMTRFMRVLLDRVSLETFNNRRELKKRNIKILSDETQDDIVYNRYVCRGYEDKFGMTREVMRAEIGNHLAKAVESILKPTKE
jgi:adenosyl cobinamide kinase/adenosyl cobinamide phosphate guanylyltransferase